MKNTTLIVMTSSLALVGGLLAQQSEKPVHPPKLPPEIMEKFDKDGDGLLNQTEREAAMAAREEIKIMMEAKFDKDGDGQLSESEKLEMKKERKKMALQYFDKDGDGALSEDEKAQMKEAMSKFRGKGSGEFKKDQEAPGAGL